MSRSIESLLLELDEWMVVFEEQERLGDALQVVYDGFLDWLKRYRCMGAMDLADIDTILVNNLGCSLAEIRQLEDGDRLRAAILGLGTAQTVGERRSPDSLRYPQDWAKSHTEYGTGTNQEPPNDADYPYP